MLYKRLVLNEVRKLIINVVLYEIEYSKTDIQIEKHNTNTLRYVTQLSLPTKYSFFFM